MLAAGHGDALLVEYGDPAKPRRILVDGGPYYAYDDPGGLRLRLHALLAAGQRVTLRAPRLPSLTHGLYLVRFRVLGPAGSPVRRARVTG